MAIEGFTIGRMVHYVAADGQHCAAVVTALGKDQELGECELNVSFPGFGWRLIPLAVFDPHAHAAGSWHWMEHV